jgi:GNAT superfamily N-acetyltransferase
MEADPTKEQDLTEKVVAAAIVKSKKRKRQSSIMNYLMINNQPPAVTQPEAQLAYVHDDLITGPVDQLIFSGDGADYDAKEQTGKYVAELTLYWDERSKTYWVNNISVNEAYRRKGVATLLLKMACEEHGTIYFSTQLLGEDTSADTRSMSTEGAGLARRAANNGELKVEIKHPRDLPAR